MQHSNSLQVSFVLLSKVIKSVIGLQFCWSVFKIVEYNSTRKSVSTCSMSVDTEAPPTLLCSAVCPVAGSFCQLNGNSVLLTPAYAVPCTITLVRPFQARATWSSSAYSPWKRHIICVCIATDGGKSLCMFLAPLASSSSAIAVVISPLIGLMDEKVRSSLSIWTAFLSV